MNRRRICHVTTVHPWQDTRIFERMCVGLARRGYDVTLVAPVRRPRSVACVRLVPTGLRTKVGRLFGAPALLRRLAALRADVYHFHDPELLPWMAWFRRAHPLIRVVYDVHEYYAETVVDSNYFGWRPLSRAAGTAFGYLEPRLARRLDAVVAVTEPIGCRFRSLGVPVTVVRNFVPLDRIPTPLPAVSLPSTRTIVLAGVMDRIRLMPELLDALALLLPRWPDLHFLGIGNLHANPYGEELRRHAARLGISERVTFMPRQPWSRVQAFLARSVVGLVLLADRVNFRWSLPTRLFEFMAHGVPVIASDVPLVRHVLEETRCGILLESAEAHAIAAAVERLLSNPGEAGSLGARGREAVFTRYNWESELGRLEAVYGAI